MAASSVGVFWAGLLLQILFAVQLGWLPLAGLRSSDHELLVGLAALGDRAVHLVLPVICLSYGGLAYVSRFVRATLLENADEAFLARLLVDVAEVNVVELHSTDLLQLFLDSSP